jgi:hypothetical protein
LSPLDTDKLFAFMENATEVEVAKKWKPVSE